MIANLDVLRKEITKLQNTLGETQPKDFKRYATIFNSYLTAVANFNQTEAILRNQEAERKRLEEVVELYTIISLMSDEYPEF